jgi:hypothetical protein
MQNRESIIMALLEGIPEQRQGIVRRMLEHVIDHDRVNYQMSIPMMRRVVDHVNLDSADGIPEALIGFVANHVKYSTVYEDHYLGKTVDPEADYLTGLSDMFVAHWNFTHPVLKAD